jgi:hypothetical protein
MLKSEVDAQYCLKKVAGSKPHNSRSGGHRLVLKALDSPY